jgi:hypothetical protein
VKRRNLSVPSAQQTVAIEALRTDDADVTASAFDPHIGVQAHKIEKAVEPTVRRHQYGRRRTDQTNAEIAVTTAAKPNIIEPSRTIISRLHRMPCSMFVLM